MAWSEKARIAAARARRLNALLHRRYNINLNKMGNLGGEVGSLMHQVDVRKAPDSKRPWKRQWQPDDMENLAKQIFKELGFTPDEVQAFREGGLIPRIVEPRVDKKYTFQVRRFLEAWQRGDFLGPEFGSEKKKRALDAPAPHVPTVVGKQKGKNVGSPRVPKPPAPPRILENPVPLESGQSVPYPSVPGSWEASNRPFDFPVQFDPKRAGIKDAPLDPHIAVDPPEGVKIPKGRHWDAPVVARDAFQHDQRRWKSKGGNISTLSLEVDPQGERWFTKRDKVVHAGMPPTRNQSAIERLGYAVGTAMGVMTPPTFVSKDNDGGLVSGMLAMKDWLEREFPEYVSVRLPGERELGYVLNSWKSEEASQLTDSDFEDMLSFPLDEWLKFATFDTLMANTDRHDGNFFVGERISSEGKTEYVPLAIDNGLMLDGRGSLGNYYIQGPIGAKAPNVEKMKTSIHHLINPSDADIASSSFHRDVTGDVPAAIFRIAAELHKVSPDSRRDKLMQEKVAEAVAKVKQSLASVSPEAFDAMLSELPDFAFQNGKFAGRKEKPPVHKDFYRALYGQRWSAVTRALEAGIPASSYDPNGIAGVFGHNSSAYITAVQSLLSEIPEVKVDDYGDGKGSPRPKFIPPVGVLRPTHESQDEISPQSIWDKPKDFAPKWDSPVVGGLDFYLERADNVLQLAMWVRKQQLMGGYPGSPPRMEAVDIMLSRIASIKMGLLMDDSFSGMKDDVEEIQHQFRKVFGAVGADTKEVDARIQGAWPAWKSFRDAFLKDPRKSEGLPKGPVPKVTFQVAVEATDLLNNLSAALKNRVVTAESVSVFDRQQFLIAGAIAKDLKRELGTEGEGRQDKVKQLMSQLSWRLAQVNQLVVPLPLKRGFGELARVLEVPGSFHLIPDQNKELPETSRLDLKLVARDEASRFEDYVKEVGVQLGDVTNLDSLGQKQARGLEFQIAPRVVTLRKAIVEGQSPTDLRVKLRNLAFQIKGAFGPDMGMMAGQFKILEKAMRPLANPTPSGVVEDRPIVNMDFSPKDLKDKIVKVKANRIRGLVMGSPEHLQFVSQFVEDKARQRLGSDMNPVRPYMVKQLEQLLLKHDPRVLRNLNGIHLTTTDADFDREASLVIGLTATKVRQNCLAYYDPMRRVIVMRPSFTPDVFHHEVGHEVYRSSSPIWQEAYVDPDFDRHTLYAKNAGMVEAFAESYMAYISAGGVAKDAKYQKTFDVVKAVIDGIYQTPEPPPKDFFAGWSQKPVSVKGV